MNWLRIRSNKYGNKWSEYKGTKYQSKKEAAFAEQLDFIVKAGEIDSWDRQVKFSIDVNGKHICNYFCDFVTYVKPKNLSVNIEVVKEYFDVKGMKHGAAYELFKIKKKLVEAIYNIEIKEI